MIALTLPWPPSVNRIWRTPNKGPLAGRTMLAADGREYRLAVQNTVLNQLRSFPQLPGRLKVVLTLNPPDRRRRDIDNSAKAVLDSLMHAGVYRDDSQIDDLHIVREQIISPGRVLVSIEELARAA
ncbi:MAG: RusA family crossover junction endodeoxyribonuclease [Luteibacter jiangsuensis]